MSLGEIDWRQSCLRIESALGQIMSDLMRARNQAREAGAIARAVTHAQLRALRSSARRDDARELLP